MRIEIGVVTGCRRYQWSLSEGPLLYSFLISFPVQIPGFGLKTRLHIKTLFPDGYAAHQVDQAVGSGVDL